MTIVSRFSSALRKSLPPRQLAAFVAIAIGLAWTGMGSQAAQGGSVVEVQLDQARTVSLPDNVKTLIIGNPVIADITTIKNGSTIIITGKGYGETNLIAMDAQGKVLAESTIRVIATRGKMLVQRGMERETYVCSPYCQPTLSLGDSPKYTGDVAAQIGTRNGLSVSGAAPIASK